MYRRALFLIILFSSSIVITESCYAMPGWARQYRFSCTTCHAPFPRLKAFGDEFAGNGFRLPEGEPARTTYDTGDPLLSLARNVPLGFRMDLFGTYEPDTADKSKPCNDEADLKTPYNLKILSGGPLADRVAYYFYFFMSERGEIAGIEDAFLFFSDVFGSGINVTAGQFAVSDPLFKNELRLTYEGYKIFDIKPPRSYANLKYDRGLVFDYSFDFGLDLVLEIVNGNGIDEAAGTGRTFDQDYYKNTMVRASQDLGPVRIGGFGYWGKESNTARPESSSYYDNVLTYYGVDLTFARGPFELNALFLERHDTNPEFIKDETGIDSRGIMVEALLLPSGEDGRWAITALYNKFESDFEGDLLEYETATMNVSYLAFRNVKFLTEYSRIMKDYSRGPDFENMDRFLFGVVTAF